MTNPPPVAEPDEGYEWRPQDEKYFFVGCLVISVAVGHLFQWLLT